ncbi:MULTISPECIES: hydrogenase nickel incorporation protein HypB [Campylobacter]|uniref:hydrogenase nickel incorporation protein HypB n=1 Tax=Campylobacter TaxID=194 RepID=UPI000A34249E|nr:MULTISPECIES: hydrogenase nickel incorporation protein HypB [Campylobacter]MBE6430082.1 hydrogenase nickel incorporation protein HypB [Campylobacter sp.]MBQ3167193.1 hydrogenase nickel incorporation protein HypB [Campylobacter sp.]MBQ8820145.1 hydrogenase nickel incorporation protein HypB [Campylobacter sp.]MBR2148203.1 hydrogenase nickel incorporation protein HypB [Campylobacter sp.]MDL0095830.1 hydrogenase nickel incorporation protein HypB [Campylobacter ovis]
MCKDCGCSMGGSHHHSHDDHHNHHHHGHHDHPVLNEKKTIEVVEKILKDNDHEAAHNRAHLDEYGLLCINLMSSPGAGKTTLLEATIKASGLKIGVVEGDLETNMDANRVVNAGGVAYQISTGQTCHLDAFMVHNGLHHLPLNELDLVFIENVGNLVCPASYDVGAHLNAVLISVPEGSDKVAKYPVMFRAADVVIITKIGLLEHFDFDVEVVKKEARKLNPKVDIIEVDSRSNQGIDKWINYIKVKKEAR